MSAEKKGDKPGGTGNRRLGPGGWRALALGFTGLLLAGAGWGECPADRRPEDYMQQRELSEGWEFVRGDLGGIWETLRSDKRSLKLPVWAAVNLPHCYNGRDAVDPDEPYYQGPAWYRTTLAIDNPYPDGHTLLHFEGAGQKTEVWIGDQRVAAHIGGYDEFTIDITEAVAEYRSSGLANLPADDYRVPAGRVPLAVRCDNSRDLEMIPSDLSDFNLYGGLYRPVHLAYLPQFGLDRVKATPRLEEDGTWMVSLAVHFLNEEGEATPAPQTLKVRILNPVGQVIHRHEADLVPSDGEQELPLIELPYASLWSPDKPQLYGVEVTASGPDGASRVWTRFGLRTFEFVDHGPFKLNGERLLLHGTHRHEDYVGQGQAGSDDLRESEMRLMKAMGVNFIRLGHYQQSRRILELCDELGIIVWEEIPWCRGGLGGVQYQAQARSMLTNMITRHYNHPSVVLWGLGNENDWPGDFFQFDQDRIRTFMGELNSQAHRLDPARVTAIRRCDFCKDVVDVYSPSIWAGWYRGKFTEYKQVSGEEMKKVSHFLHVEWGGDSHAGRHAEDPYALLRDLKEAGAADERGLDFQNIGGEARASRDGDWSETYICDLVDWHLKEQETMDWLTGTAMWVFKDFSTPLRPNNPVPYVNQKGAVERDLTPKESYYVYQSYWAQDPMVHIYGHTWPVRWGNPGEKRWLKVYSNCPEVELWLNGQSLGRRKRDSQDFPAAGLRWSTPFEPGMNHLRAVGTMNGVTCVDETTFRYESRAWDVPDHIRLQQFPTARENQVRVQAELLDANGVVCLDSRAFLRFGHAGDGRLLDDLGTAGGSRRVQLANGRAQIDTVLPAGGQAVISAGLEDGSVQTALIRLRE